MLLLLDSRDRVNSTEDPATCKFRLVPPIDNIRKITLHSFDLPIPDDAQDEGTFYIVIEEFGYHVRGCDNQDSGTFVVFRETEAGTRTPIYDNNTFHQSFEIPPRSISEINLRVVYRNASSETIVLGGDFNMLLNIE